MKLLTIAFFTLFILNINCRKPNIILIVVDDYGWGDVGLHGSSQVRTPNIDILATNGITLNNYYVSPVCSPSRGALLTGLHPIHTGAINIFAGAKPDVMPLKYKFLPQYLKDMGYETHGIGKWHLGFYKRPYIPTQRGFDSFFGYWNGEENYYDRTHREGSFNGVDFHDNEEPVPLKQYEGQYSTHIYTNKSIQIIMNQKSNTSKPLFLYLAHQSVHCGGPTNKTHRLQVPQQYVDRFQHIKDLKRRLFAAMVSVLDDSVGEIFSALQKAEILNDTIIIFTTDNGAAVPAHQLINDPDKSSGSNWPLRGSKYTLFEGGIRGFSFIWSPLLKKQYVSQQLMHITDWLPTIFGAIGGNLTDLGNIDGNNMWDVLNNNSSSPRKQLLHNIDDNTHEWALRDGDFKLTSGSPLKGRPDWFSPPGESNHTDLKNFEKDYHKKSKVYEIYKQMKFTYKTVEPILVDCNITVKSECKQKHKPCLFDLRSDPCEYNNIYDKRPDIVKSMLKQLAEYNSTAVKPLTTKLDPRSNPDLHNHQWGIWD